MNKTLRTSFSIRNAYRVNAILFSIKQVPVLRKILPQQLYAVSGLKIFANIISVIWELLSAVLGKFLYLLLMVFVPLQLYQNVDTAAAFLQILLLLTIIGSFVNTYMFNPTKDKYYAMFLLRMNAREYTLVNYGYAMLKVFVGFLLFGLLFGRMSGVPFLICLLIPFFVMGFKLTVAAMALRDYEKKERITNENHLGIAQWVVMTILCLAAYVLPFLKVVMPMAAVVAAMLLVVLSGVFAVSTIWKFPSYRRAYQEILNDSTQQMEQAKKTTKEQSQKIILADTSIVSRRKGFEYLNELFIKRHQKILWKSSKRITYICSVLFVGLILLCCMRQDICPILNELVMNNLPLMAFVMYFLNRGTPFTQALFMNCDHSLLTYSFYKKPKSVLRLFRIRQWEIIKVNLLPAVVIGGGLALLLYVSGGTDNALNYAVLFATIVALSIFFSVHYLTMYYLLQPYNAGTELKSGMYQIVMWLTYFVCYALMQFDMPTLVFGSLAILFCVLYAIIACILVYFIAPRTFKLRT